jgi:hypothetical protein
VPELDAALDLHPARGVALRQRIEEQLPRRVIAERSRVAGGR